jgi:hypothetical protein
MSFCPAFRIAVLAAFVFVLSCSTASAQAVAQISGTVKDSTGAVLPGVTVTATQTDTGIARETVTNDTGAFVLTNLPIGPYRVEAALPGFSSSVQTGIVLQVNANPNLTVVLQVSQVSETVEVQASAALVETRQVGVGQVVENERILELPLNGRQVTELVALAGAATPTTQGVAGRNPFARTVISVAGGSSMGLNYELDGANHNNPFFNTYLSVPFPDALEEFRVETSGTGAQSGTKSAGTVSLVTKSGTNQYRGNAFEFVRNGKFNAKNFFAEEKDNLRRNQFGGTLGGPIVQNKMFFFAAYQGTRERENPLAEESFVPTAAMLAGDFTTLASPACNGGRTLTLRAPVVNNRVDPALFSKAAVAFASRLPAATDPCGRVSAAAPEVRDEHMGVFKVDYQRTQSHSIFGRYVVESIYEPTPYSLSNNLLTVAAGSDGLSQAFTFGSTNVFGNNVVNALRVSTNRAANVQTGSEYFRWPELGVKMFAYPAQRAALYVNDYFEVQHGGAGATQLMLYAVNDDLNMVRGNHQWSVGGHVAWWEGTSFSDFYSYGRATFNGTSTGSSMTDFLLGNVGEWVMGTPAPQDKSDMYIGLYGADTWQLNDRLTLNYGLRWEPWFPPINREGSAIHWDEDAWRQGVRSTKFRNTPPGLFFEGDPGFPGKRAMNIQWWNLSPRVGMAWDLAGDGRTSLRSSFGTFYDYVHMFYHVGLSNAPPTSQRQIVQGVNLDDPWRTWPGGDPFPMAHGADVTPDVPWSPFSIVTALQYDTPNTRVHQWNVSLQRQLGTNWAVSATYLGSMTDHLWGTRQLNPAIYIPGVGDANGNCIYNGRPAPFTVRPGAACSSTANTNQRRRLFLENPQTGQYFGTVNLIDPNGTASYKGLLLSVSRRAARGLTLNGNYTLSHCISDAGGSDVGNSGSANGGYVNPETRDRGNCLSNSSSPDRRHNFNLSASIATPEFSNGAARALASGWRFSPLIRIMSGGFYNVTTRDVALIGVSNQRVNQVQDNVYGDKTVNRYLNPAAFAQPATGTIGNLRPGSIEGPGYWTFDAALTRAFELPRTQRLEFRVEAFNVTNALRMRTLVTNFNAGNFGKITTAEDPRIMQFALKYFF